MTALAQPGTPRPRLQKKERTKAIEANELKISSINRIERNLGIRNQAIYMLYYQRLAVLFGLVLKKLVPLAAYGCHFVQAAQTKAIEANEANAWHINEIEANRSKRSQAIYVPYYQIFAEVLGVILQRLVPFCDGLRLCIAESMPPEPRVWRSFSNIWAINAGICRRVNGLTNGETLPIADWAQADGLASGLPAARLCRVVALSLVFLAGAPRAISQTPEERTARHFEAIRQQPSLLLDFLARMPKGGDLHNHLSGAVYAESYINFAARDSLCADRTMTLLPPPCDAAKGQEPVAGAFDNPPFYYSLIDAWSMRDFHPSPQDRSGHDHFFAAFGKFGRTSDAHTGEMLAEVASRAAAQHESYLELMFGPDKGAAARLGAKLGWDDDFGKMRERLLANGLNDAVVAGRKNLDDDEREMRQALHCSDVRADAGCGVTVRYLYQVLRGLPKETVFAQILCGFEMARADSRVVGLNLVMPEDDYIPMRDFDLHMRMLDYLHKLYPEVHISLHAGELAPGLVPPDGLRFHIRESVERGHAERIGHGVDVMQEADPAGLLKEMATRKVLVEICLTSNDLILGVRGGAHPLPVYLLYDVPVGLATDDEGVSRSELTWEFERAAETYKLSYPELKKMVRDSLDHSFLPGASLWEAPEKFRPAAACAGEAFKALPASQACRKFLAGSEKAQLEWKEEADFSRFESGF